MFVSKAPALLRIPAYKKMAKVKCSGLLKQYEIMYTFILMNYCSFCHCSYVRKRHRVARVLTVSHL